jgi:hypothetical protein
MATQELVVPKSIPITSPTSLLFHRRCIMESGSNEEEQEGRMYDDGETRADEEDRRVVARRKPILRATKEIDDDMGVGYSYLINMYIYI